MSSLRRLMSSRAPVIPSLNLGHRPATVPVLASAKKAAGDINIRHNFAVQKYARHPFNLKTNVIVVTHADGFLATLEWRWVDPSRGGKTNVSVTSGIHSTKKMAISAACRSMLMKQKLLDETETELKEAVDEVHVLVREGKYAQACKAMVHAHTQLDTASKPQFPRSTFPTLWRHVVASHDIRLTELLLLVLEHGEVPSHIFEDALQELSWLPNQTFAESILHTLSQDKYRVSVSASEGGFLSHIPPTESEVSQWKRWRVMLAMEELCNIQSALSNRELIESFRMTLETATVPMVRLRGWINASAIPVDSVVLLASSSNRDMHLTGKVVESVARPDGEQVVTVRLLSEEQSPLLFKESHLDLAILAESRVTFERMAVCLRNFYGINKTQDFSYRIDQSVRALLLGGEAAAGGNRVKLEGVPTASLSTLQSRMELSPVQFSAVMQSINHRVSLIHGPAGTGKTHTLCGLITAWHEMSESKILACADSNTATDNIYTTLRRRGIPAFRYGSWRSLVDLPDDVLDALPNKGLVDKYRSAAFAFKTDPERNRGFLIGVRRQIEEEAVKHFKVIVTTLSSSRAAIFDKCLFPNVVIDEAAQTVEPATLLAISHGCERLVLVGDHKQLPAVVLSKRAEKLGYSNSLFQRLIQSDGFPSVLLNCQRRMHPEISAWPNKEFYGGKLEDHADTHRWCSGDFWDLTIGKLCGGRRVVFVDTDGAGNGEQLVGTSTRNSGESAVIVGVVERILLGAENAGVADCAKQMGVIVPYLAQKAIVVEALKRRRLPSIEVNTVEGFQGREKEIMIISTTRSNVSGVLGFLDDDQRMNVMLTRARKGLVVVGDKQTLKKRGSSKWSQFVQYLEEKKSIFPHKTFIHNTIR